MSFLDLVKYAVAVSIAIGSAMLIRRVYVRGSGRARASLTGGAFVVLAVALLVFIFGR